MIVASQYEIWNRSLAANAACKTEAVISCTGKRIQASIKAETDVFASATLILALR